MQQACDSGPTSAHQETGERTAARAEKTVEVVRNHADGTRLRGWSPRTEAKDRLRTSFAGVDAPEHVDEGEHRASRSKDRDAAVPDPPREPVSARRTRGRINPREEGERVSSQGDR